jgi:hypothetical protein
MFLLCSLRNPQLCPEAGRQAYQEAERARRSASEIAALTSVSRLKCASLVHIVFVC